jgi:phosphatidylinositol-3-phosphatase
MTRVRIIAAAVALALISMAVPSSALAAIPSPAASPTVVQAAHLIVVMDENNGIWLTTGTAANRADWAYLNSLWTSPAVDSFRQMFGITHPSQPNYLGLAAGSTLGVTSDATKAGKYNVPTVWDQLTAAGVSWGVYQEGMPGTCSPVLTFNDSVTMGQYALKHNPATPFAPVYTSSECQHVQPLSALDPANLPAVSFITPNICNDAHGFPASDTVDNALFPNCVTGTSALRQRADAWLQARVPGWVAAGATVVITFDEGGTDTGINGTSGGGQLAAVELGAGVAGGQITSQLNHYSITAAIEDAWGLPLLGNAATAVPLPVG